MNKKFQSDPIAPMHTTEHILNQTMVRMFGCPRSKNAHIERRKSKCDYMLEQAPTNEEVQQIEEAVNNVINSNLPIIESYLSVDEAAEIVDMSKLPENAPEMLRIIRVGDYDVCACSGKHVENTSAIGRFEITTHTFADGIWRVRFKLRDRD